MRPREYQQNTLDRVLGEGHSGFGLFYEQRVGKTPTALFLSKEWGCHKNLVICPKKAIPVWHRKIGEFGFDSVEWTVITFARARISKEDFKRSWDLVIVDESHYIKERDSSQTQAIWSIGRKAKRRLVLSGTPQGDGMENYYPQLRFIRPDLFPSWKDFSEKYLIIERKLIPGHDNNYYPKIVGYKNQDQFKEILASISDRVERAEVSTVKTIVRKKIHLIPWERENRVRYEELDDQLFTMVNGVMSSAPMILTKGLRLHQLCGGYLKDDEGTLHRVGSEKFNYLARLISGMSEKAVIVCQYKAEMDRIADLLKGMGVTYTQIRGRRQYDPEDRSQFTILNCASGEAIELAHAKRMIVFSMNYSFLKWSQFKDRIVLVDTPEVYYDYLIMKDSMDQVIYDTVVEKKKLAEEIISIYKVKRNQVK